MYINATKGGYYARKYALSSTAISLLIASLFISGVVVIAPMLEDNRTERLQPGISQTLMENMYQTNGNVQVLITTETHDYANLVDAVHDLGGTVTQQYRYATGIAAEMSRSAVFRIAEREDVISVELDEQRSPNELTREQLAAFDLGIESATTLDSSMYAPLELSFAELNALRGGSELNNYGNQLAHNVNPLWAEGNFGAGSLVVVIDTGIYADHTMFLPGQVVGGVDLSTDVGTVYEDPFSVNNHYHGTHVSGTIAGNAAYLFPTDSLLVQSMLAHGYDVPEYDESNSIVTLFGNAPDALLYAVKVFDHTGGSASNSIIIAGIEHAIALHESGTDVDVINMSLGGGTGYEGRDLESQAVDYGTSVGITFVVSAGNDGPAPLTIGTPSGANTAITVAASVDPAHTRVFWDFNYGFIGAGDLLFTSNDPQIVYFSSRGPTSDGRDKPTASAVGTFVLSSMTGGPFELGFLSGTSMASPNMAGVVALLNSVGEGMGASPYDYKQAIRAGSHMMPGFEDFEQGAGLVNAQDAMTELLADRHLGSTERGLKHHYSPIASQPEGQNLGRGGTSSFSITNLAPGHVEYYWFRAHPNLEKISLDVSNVDLGVDPIEFNSFEVHVMSPIRSTDIYYLYSVNVYGDAHLEVSDLNSAASGNVYGVNALGMPLMDGYIRIAIENDWTSYDQMSGDFVLTLETGHTEWADEYYFGSLENHESEGFFEVGFGTNGVMLELNWLRDWALYPTSDLDMIVAWFDTDGNLYYVYSGATFSSPEMVVIDSANVAAVYVLVDGFETYGFTEYWLLGVHYL